MIFRQALRRELTQIAGGVFVTLFTIMATTQSIRLLGQAAGGRLPSEAVLALLGFSALSYLPVLLSLTVFMSILLTISRQYRDSEMVVWFASGQSLLAWVRPVLAFALPFVAMVALLSLVASPWAATQTERYRERVESRDEAARISPGAFKESARADRVFFVENTSVGSERVQNVFVNTIQHGKLGIMVSKSGFTEIAPNGDKFLVMVNGRRYEGEPGRLDYKIMDFERYAVRVEQKADRIEPETTPKQLTTLALIEDRSNPNKGEFLWRVGLPISALVLALLAIPLSFVNPRAGRSINLVFAILIYMVYSNCISITQAWVAQGKVGFWAAWWLVHLAMFLVLMALFWRRLSLQSVFALLRR